MPSSCSTIPHNKTKNSTLKKIGIVLIRVRERPLKTIDRLDLVTRSQGIHKNDVDKLLQNIPLNEVETSFLIGNYTKHENFQCEDAYKKALSELPYPPFEKSLSSTHPELIEQWDLEKNGPLLSSAFSGGSHYEALWICPNGHSYQAQIERRTRGSGCPVCANKVVTSENNFLVTHPKVASEWHPHNTRLPSEFVSGSDYYARWRCSVNSSHEWQATIKARTRPKNPTGCPYCSGRLPDEDNNLLGKFPEVAEEWHPEKNGYLTPENLSPKSDQKVWWICLTHSPPYEWKTSVKHRTLSKSGCPKCGRLRVNASSKKAVQQIDNDGNVIRSWNSVRECADTLVLETHGLRDSIERSVAKVCRNERTSWKTMKFRYVS